MNVKFLNPFLEAAADVLRIEAGIRVNRGELSLEKTPYLTNDVSVIISLVGSVVGTVIYSMDNRFATFLASKIMGEDLDEFNSLAQSGVAELGNVITGSASVRLSDAGFDATISPPTLLLGQGATVSTLDFPRLVLPLHAENGQIVIHLALRENPNARLLTSQIPVPGKPVV